MYSGTVLEGMRWRASAPNHWNSQAATGGHQYRCLTVAFLPVLLMFQFVNLIVFIYCIYCKFRMRLPSEGFEKQPSRIIRVYQSIHSVYICVYNVYIHIQYSLTGTEGFAFGQRLLLFEAGPYCDSPEKGQGNRVSVHDFCNRLLHVKTCVYITDRHYISTHCLCHRVLMFPVLQADTVD